MGIFKAYDIRGVYGTELTEAELDFPTVEDGIEGVKFIHAAVESSKKDAAWVEL